MHSGGHWVQCQRLSDDDIHNDVIILTHKRFLWMPWTGTIRRVILIQSITRKQKYATIIMKGVQLYVEVSCLQCFKLLLPFYLWGFVKQTEYNRMLWTDRWCGIGRSHFLLHTVRIFLTVGNILSLKRSIFEKTCIDNLTYVDRGSTLNKVCCHNGNHLFDNNLRRTIKSDLKFIFNLFVKIHIYYIQ